MAEYPDPEIAANTASYPWLKDASLDDARFRSWADDLEDSCSQSLASVSTSDGSSSSDQALQSSHQENGVELDPDYSSSETSRSEDLNMSDENPTAHHELSSIAQSGKRSRLKSANWSSTQVSRRPGNVHRPGSDLPKGTRGTTRGLRKPIEPGIECTAFLSEATLAFADNDLDRAEDNTLRALQLNPEVYQAHNLLSEIHAARGHQTKAIHAAWNGAHTRPRDTRMWKRVAALLIEMDSDDRRDSLRDAAYCYSRIIAVDKYDVEARYRRAAINRELGNKRKVVAEYEALLKHLPHDTTVLRHLAETYIELNAAGKALEHYEAFIASAQTSPRGDTVPFNWSDVNILAELYLMTESFGAGLLQIKRLSRWLLGRQSDSFWDEICVDDREWDMDDEPRRFKTPGFQAELHPLQSYGSGLPLEIRTRLAILRMYVDGPESSEAKMHFDHLRIAGDLSLVRAREFSDLYREAASELRKAGRFSDALSFLSDIREAQGKFDADLLMEIASCFRALGSEAEAKRCYQTILEIEPSFVEAHVARSNMERDPAQARPSKATGSSQANKSSEQKPRYRSHKRDGICVSSEQEAEVLTLHSRWKKLGQRNDLSRDELDDRLEAGRLLTQTFRRQKVFYPIDRNQRFWGYSRDASSASNRKIVESLPSSELYSVSTDRETITVPESYMGISFSDWLDIFLQNSIDKANQGKTTSAYESIEAAIGANIFYHQPDVLLAIHLCWLSCTIVLNDTATLCSVLRWFITQQQLMTDNYRIFTAMSRLCNTQNEWFNASPTQKFLLRQIKALDRNATLEHLMPSNINSELPQSRARLGDAISPAEGQNLNVALLTLYGHILLANQSYNSAAQYFLRALSIAPLNLTIKFSLSVAYIHWAIKRQAENRHYIMAQGLTFLYEYYDDSRNVTDPSTTLIADYNVARAYYGVGLHNLAIPFLERCLDLEHWSVTRSQRSLGTEIGRQAAWALQAHWNRNGDVDRAQAITEKWLQI